MFVVLSCPYSSAQRLWLAVALFFFCALYSTRAAGLFSDGADARTIALGGTGVAQTGSALEAGNSNPAAWAGIEENKFELSGGAGFLRGDFHRSDGERSHLSEDLATLPAFGLALAGPRNFPITFGLAFVPEIMADTSWRFRDAPGGLGGLTSFGEREHRSTILAARTSLGVAVAVTRCLSLGASAGFLYNSNALHGPYVFQSHSVLAGFKTGLDLETDGSSPSYQFGLQLRPISTLTFGASYRPRVAVTSTGTASGNALEQLQAIGLTAFNPEFRYDANVRTEIPQVAAIGAEWQALPRLRLVAGLDWINWSDAFDQLHIRLSNGNNADINALVASSGLTDNVPLRWRDQWVGRTGVEVILGSGFTARTGYTYARSTVPPETLTPLTAAIFEHKVSVGLGYRHGRYHADLAWQWSLPAKERVTTSGLLDGEYSHTSVLVTSHQLQVTTGVEL